MTVEKLEQHHQVIAPSLRKLYTSVADKLEALRIMMTRDLGELVLIFGVT